MKPPADWVVPEKTYIVACTPRSGSTFFCAKVSTTGVLGRPAEFFNVAYDKHATAATHRCKVAFELGKTPNGVLGIKLFPEQFDQVRSQISLFDWFPNPIWVKIERKDLLGQAISLAIARQNDSWNSREVPQRTATYSTEEIEWALDDIAGDNRRWENFFARSEIVPLRFCYEDLTADCDIACALLADRLKLREPVPPTSEVDFEIQRTRINDDWRAKFVEAAGDPNEFDQRKV